MLSSMDHKVYTPGTLVTLSLTFEPGAGGYPFTDLRKWTLRASRDQFVWHYDETRPDDRPLRSLEQHYLMLRKPWEQDGRPVRLAKMAELFGPSWGWRRGSGTPPAADPRDSATVLAWVRQLTRFLSTLQHPVNGGWPGCNVLPQPVTFVIVIALYVFRTALKREPYLELLRYTLNIQLADGSWACAPGFLHGSPSATALGYVSLRMLGLPADHARCAEARRYFVEHDGLRGMDLLARVSLVMLGVYAWRGMYPVLPTLAAPSWLPAWLRLFNSQRPEPPCAARVLRDGAAVLAPRDDAAD